MYEIYKEFRFDAAHSLGVAAKEDPRYGQLHGHSFRVQVWVTGKPNGHGWVMDLGELDRQVRAIREQIDHRYLNDIEGLNIPTMENIAAFVWRHLSATTVGLTKVSVHRDSCNEGCAYTGPELEEAHA